MLAKDSGGIMKTILVKDFKYSLILYSLIFTSFVSFVTFAFGWTLAQNESLLGDSFAGIIPIVITIFTIFAAVGFGIFLQNEIGKVSVTSQKKVLHTPVRNEVNIKPAA